MSRPARGAWVEIGRHPVNNTAGNRRAPQGARGLKYKNIYGTCHDRNSRAPQGARGLKSLAVAVVLGSVCVAPRKGRVG